MPRSRGRRPRRITPHQSSSPSPPKESSSIWKKIGTGILITATLIGGLAAALYFVPRVTIEAVAPFDPSQPTPIAFRITNTNVVPLRNVDISLGICSLMIIPDTQPYPKPADCEGPSNVEMRFGRPWHFNWILMDEPVDISQPPLSWGNHERFSANMEIRISYSPWYAPTILFGRTKAFRFVSYPSRGKIYFKSTPLYP